MMSSALPLMDRRAFLGGVSDPSDPLCMLNTITLMLGIGAAISMQRLWSMQCNIHIYNIAVNAKIKIVVDVKVSGLPQLNTVFGGKQGHALCKIFLLQQILFLCQLNFIEITRLS